MSRDSYIHKRPARCAGRPAALRLPRHRRRREPVLSARRASCCRTRRSSRRAATSPNTARRASSAAPARASTTWTTWRARPTRWPASSRAHVEAAKPSAVLGLGYSNGANILASVLFADPALFDAAVLMHPLIPFEPEVDGSLAGRRVLITAGRRDPICPPEPDGAARSLFARGAAPMSQWNGTRAATRCGRTRSRRRGVSSPRRNRSEGAER